MPHGPILIVDDEPINLAKLGTILESDYRLVFASSGQEALTAVAKHCPSLILLDINMPDMDGYTVCRQLKADPRFESIPVLFVTALAEMGNEKEGFAAGCVDYLIKPVCPDIVKVRVKTHLSLVRSAQLERSYRDAVFMLGKAGHFNDNDTGVHIWRMGAFSRALAKSWGWHEHHCEQLELAAAMHDMGKIGVPESILRKPGELTPEERAIMQTHARIGYEILSESEAPLFKMAAEIALRHHEHWNGKGYPDGLAGDAIPESARIVIIADVFDALSMVRPYKPAWPLDKILGHMREQSGLMFDPKILEHFFGIIPNILKIQQTWNARNTQ
ncbi:response regulator [Methylomonas rivi]|uniref:Response regulator n=1 Tax=Methylomonas rivi TaxID=2952226 RepID=A0ABT1U8D5_9GAMM|nr:HD domain-containing phosphohydrolase [Methylomonas sp. WSC-6]MCQ8130102.1 response regulator [Methylomonas sp. WSC-6]